MFFLVGFVTGLFRILPEKENRTYHIRGFTAGFKHTGFIYHRTQLLMVNSIDLPEVKLSSVASSSVQRNKYLKIKT